MLVLILVAGSIDWWFTRYSLDDLAIHRRSGFLFKKNRTIRLESVQSVDISRPLVARLLGLSELRFEVADGSSEALHIKYVSARKAEVLRRTAMASINLLRSEAAGRPVDVLPDSMQISAERMPDADQLHQPFEAPTVRRCRTVLSRTAPSSLYLSSPQHPAVALVLVCRCRSLQTPRSRRFSASRMCV